MATMVKRQNIGNTISFWTNLGGSIFVDSFKDGIVDVVVTGDTIRESIKSIVGCFDNNSNFQIELCKALNINSPIRGIHTSINGVDFIITKENANVRKVLREYFYTLDKQEKEYACGNAIKLIEIDVETEISFKNEEAQKEWEEWEYLYLGTYTAKFARRWAKYMQFIIAQENTTIMDCASLTLEKFDYNRIIDGNTFRAVLFILFRCWKYGEELLKWYEEGMK